MDGDPTVAAIIGATTSRTRASPVPGPVRYDSFGDPWRGSSITASGNLRADFTANANAEMQGRLAAGAAQEGSQWV